MNTENLKNGASHRAMLSAPVAESATAPTLEDISNAVNEMGSAFEALKDANDQRLKEIEAKGSADPVLQEKVEKINADLGNASAKVDDIVKAQKKAAERQDKIEAALNRGGLGGNGDPAKDVRAEAELFYKAQMGEQFKPDAVNVEAYVAYKDAFFNHLRKGDRGVSIDVINALQVGSDADGGYLVPATTSIEIMKRLTETSEIRQYARSMMISTDRFEKLIRTSRGASGGWVGEKESRPATGTSQFKKHTIDVHEQYANPAVTQRLLDDAAVDIEGFLIDELTDELEETENTAFVNGDGVAKPRGFMSYSADAVTTADASRNWGVVQKRAIGGTSNFAVDGTGADWFIRVEHDMKKRLRAGAVYTMNKTTLGLARLIKDSDGRYIWQMGNIQAGMPQTLNNYPIAEFEDMADMANGNYPIAFANFERCYQIVDNIGIRVLRDPFTDKPNVLFYTTKRTGGDLVDFDAIKYGVATT